MKTVFALFDSLNRRSLEPYGAQTIKTPNFQRLANRSVTFDKHYVGSLPCMPARRDMQTGRLTFLHRSWGPLEPFDNSFPELLDKAGTHSHLISDHYHYWEDGGATYHNRYSTYEFVRGQEGDTWKAMVEAPWDRLREMYHPSRFNEKRGSVEQHNYINREFMRDEQDYPSVRCFNAAFEYLDTNKAADNWFLQIETFDPHEPFTAPDRFRENYPTDYEGSILDWPRYARVTEAPEECEELRANYAAIVGLCDAQLGRLLDYFDEHDMWHDTALVVTTDHGFLLGEHDWWAKFRMPVYNEVAHIPLFIHHPDYASKAGERRQSLTQTIDLMPTMLDLHGLTPPQEVEGHSILNLMDNDHPIRETALYGAWGSAANITDGEHTYFRFPEDMEGQEIFQYTLMPTHMNSFFTHEELKGAELNAPFEFTKDLPVLKIGGHANLPMYGELGLDFFQDSHSMLFDVLNDPDQLTPLEDGMTVKRLTDLMNDAMRRNDAPEEAYRRFGLEEADS